MVEGKIIQLMLTGMLGIAAFMDYREKSIHLLLPFVLFFSGSVFQLILGNLQIYEMALGCIVGMFLLLLAYLSKEAIGYGDGLMMIGCGPFLGFIGCMELLLLALSFSGIVSIIMLIIRKKRRTEDIPFLPFLLLGNVTMLAAGMI